LNGRFAGRKRDGRQSFNHWPAGVLVPRDSKAQTLSRLVDYNGQQVAPCTMAVFENKLGGRVCVAGYFPWTFLQNLSKSSQMKSVMRWLSKDRLVAYVASYHEINLWVREPEDGKVALAFTNSSFDPAVETALMLRTDRRQVHVFDMNCHETVIQATESDGCYQKFVIPEIGPWQMRLVVTDLNGSKRE
jgi:hypothetical protein